MAQQERALRTRRVILEAAAAVFDECGYESATIGAVVARAGVTRGALYFHFTSKQQLAEGVIEEQFSRDTVPPRASKLQEVIDLGLLLAHQMPLDPLLSAGARLQLGGGEVGELASGAIRGWIERVDRLLTVAREQGELLPHVVPADTAWLIAACWTGTQVQSQRLSDRADLERRIASLFQHLLPSIATPGVLATLRIHPTRGAEVATEVAAQQP